MVDSHRWVQPAALPHLRLDTAALQAALEAGAASFRAFFKLSSILAFSERGRSMTARSRFSLNDGGAAVLKAVVSGRSCFQAVVH